MATVFQLLYHEFHLHFTLLLVGIQWRLPDPDFFKIHNRVDLSAKLLVKFPGRPLRRAHYLANPLRLQKFDRSG